MDLIKIIKDEEVLNEDAFEIRETARAVLIDRINMIPVLFVSKFNYHKLPGGGIDPGETKEKALTREVKE